MGMRAALVLVALVLVGSTVSAAAVATAKTANAYTHHGKTVPPLRVPARLSQALVRRGYPVRHPCGFVLEPPPLSGTHGGVSRSTEVRACWLVIYRDGYSVSITPHSSRAAARLAYQRTYNKWARNTRRIKIGRLLVSAFRAPVKDWNVIRRIVSAVAIPRR
jgi:hypothetical protein